MINKSFLNLEINVVHLYFVLIFKFNFYPLYYLLIIFALSFSFFSFGNKSNMKTNAKLAKSRI